MPDELLTSAYLEKPTYTLVVQWEMTYLLLKETEQCLRCGRMFVGLENIGAWKCRQHAFKGTTGTGNPILDLKAGDLWPCCGALVKADSFNNGGCVPADHTILRNGYAWEFHEDFYVPKFVFDELKGVRPDAVISSHQYQLDQEYGKQLYTESHMDNPIAPHHPRNIRRPKAPARLDHEYRYIRRFDFREHARRSLVVPSPFMSDLNLILDWRRNK